MFTCNVCGFRNAAELRPFEREEPGCVKCGSTVRMRSMLRALSLELFGLPLIVGDFPRIKSLRGLGTSDSGQYAEHLAVKFDYRNTFYHREPRFDLVHPPAHELGRYDFIVSSEVLEHVLPPIEQAFASLYSLLKPGGVLILTVPYSLEATMAEHYPEAHEFGLVRLGDRLTLVNRTASGQVQLFDHPVFHIGWGGDALEMREFNEAQLVALLRGAGFPDIVICAGEDPQFGIVQKESWSLPVVARKGEFSFSREAARDLIEHWREVSARNARYESSYWTRIGRKLGLL